MREHFVCPTCGKDRPLAQRVHGDRLRRSVRDRILVDVPSWDGEFTCRPDVHKYRMLVVREAIEQQRGHLADLDASVLQRMEKNQLLSKHLGPNTDTLGARVADTVASFGGSWRFIGIFAAVLASWIGINALFLAHPFDPYPFILLNLVLSCLAAIQAPVIMMSQNRQEAKDRDRSEQDYETNLKAELELQLLHEKMDHLLFDEWQRLLEVQAVQTEMLEELTDRASRSGK